MLAFLLTPFAYLPLWLLHAIGTGLGWLIYWASPRYRQTLNENIRQSGLCQDNADYTRLIRASVIQHGRGGMELPYIWCRSFPHLISKVRHTSGTEYIRQAFEKNSPIIFVMPHLGSIDLCGVYLSTCLPLAFTVMYRPSKIKGLEKMIQRGRNRQTVMAAPANISGVRMLIKALKNKEAIIILPDQAPSAGEGVWAPFFGRPAYTMTLLARLAQNSAATILMCYAERLPHGRGFHVHILPMKHAFMDNKIDNAAQINRHIEKLIAQAPAQYLWSYNRYKRPHSAPPIPKKTPEKI